MLPNRYLDSIRADTHKLLGVQDATVCSGGEGVKRLRHPILGPIGLEYSAFAVDGRSDLSMIVYNPATRDDADRIRSLVTP
jgi:hypothetical protein